MSVGKIPSWNLTRTKTGDEAPYDVDREAVRLIRQHRELLANHRKSVEASHSSGIMRFDCKTVQAESLKFMQFLDPTGIYRPPPPPPRDVSFKKSVPPGLEIILVKEIDHDVDKVYEDRVLLLTITEDPMDGCNQTTLIGRDQEGRALEVFVTDLPQTEEIHELLAFGTQIGIINPYHRAGVHGNFIEVYDPEDVIRLGRKTEMCRYCGEENSPLRCTNCKATYCSRKCQVADWKELNHKKICKPAIKTDTGSGSD